MKIGQPFNKLTRQEYIFYIDHYKKYKDFNTLGLYRSILENSKLALAEKIEVCLYAHQTFRKTFDFLQLKDPQTYFDLITLGQELTKADEQQVWRNIIAYQQQVLADKKIKHRNFGTYSKHDCGNAACYLNGLMIRRGSSLSYGTMHFESDKNRNIGKYKSKLRRGERKRIKQIIQQDIDSG